MFSADPAKYAPVLGGDCVVSLVKMQKRVPGNIRYASVHDGRLFLFANEQGKQMFTADPKSFANADLAFGGQCAVCRVEMKQAMAGKSEFTVVHNGLRYLFPAVEQWDMFLANPKKYEDVGASIHRALPGVRLEPEQAMTAARNCPNGFRDARFIFTEYHSAASGCNRTNQEY